MSHSVSRAAGAGSSRSPVTIANHEQNSTASTNEDCNETTIERRQSQTITRAKAKAMATNASTNADTTTKTIQVSDFILLTPYPCEPGHTLISVVRLDAADWKPEMNANATFVAKGDNAGIIIMKAGNIIDYAKANASQQSPSAKMSFKVFLINSETGKLTLEHRTLRFWLEHSTVSSSSNACKNGNGSSGTNSSAEAAIADANGNADDHHKSTRTIANIRQESSHLAQAYFCQLIGSKPDDDFPKNYVAFLMKLMRLLKGSQFARVIKMEVELRQLAYEDHTKPPSRASSFDGSQGGDSSGRGSPLTSQKVLDIIESSYPNPISIRDICSTTQTEESVVRQFVDELASKEKINSTDDGQNYTRTTKPIDTKVNLVKQMPKVIKSQQPNIAIITAQYCEKLAVDSMISDKETFVRYRTTTTSGSQPDSAGSEFTSANYIYTLGNIGDHRVVSTKLTSVGHSRGALIAAGNATTRLLGTFPEIDFVFLVGCGGGVVNYTDFSSHVRLGDVVIAHMPLEHQSNPMEPNEDDYVPFNKSSPADHDYVYVHCRPKQQDTQKASVDRYASRIPASYSVHKNLRRATSGNDSVDLIARSASQDDSSSGATAGDTEASSQEQQAAAANKPLDYEECHFRFWRPVCLDLQDITHRLWLLGLKDPKHRIWEYYIDEGIKNLRQQDIDASRPAADTDKLFMSIGSKDAIEVSHPEASEDEIDLRRQGRPMCHFGPIGSGRPPSTNETLKQRMISEFGLRAFDSEFDPVVESIYGNCKERFIMIRGISDYKDGRKRKEWQQYSALVAAAFMKSVIVTLPTDKPSKYNNR